MEIKLTDDIVPYILYQRTAYLKTNLVFQMLTVLGYWKPLYNFCVAVQAKLFNNRIKQSYVDDMVFEFNTMKPYLPETANASLDIGCGLAGIDILISRHYQDDVSVFLLDKSQIDKKVYYRFHEKGSFYNSLELSKKSLVLNEVNLEKIHYQEATDKNEIFFETEFDLIISLISWGFHYPVDTYLDSVHEKLKEGGVLILDIRSNTTGYESLMKKFGNCEVIHKTARYSRVICKKHSKM